MFKKRFFLAMAFMATGFSFANPIESKMSQTNQSSLWPNLHAFEIPSMVACSGGGSETFANLDITVSVDTTTFFSQAINVTGNVTIEIRNSSNRIIVDDIAWNCYTGTAKSTQTAASDFKVYPNPNNGQFQLDLSNGEKRSIEVYNFSGNLILTQTVIGKETIDLGNAPKGIYLLKVKSGDVVSDKKIVIE